MQKFKQKKMTKLDFARMEAKDQKLKTWIRTNQAKKQIVANDYDKFMNNPKGTTRAAPVERRWIRRLDASKKRVAKTVPTTLDVPYPVQKNLQKYLR